MYKNVGRKCRIAMLSFLCRYVTQHSFAAADDFNHMICSTNNVFEDDNAAAEDVAVVGSSPPITTRDAMGPFYTDDTPWTNRIAPEDQLVISSNRLVVEGLIVGRNCESVGTKILIEPWYAGLPDTQGNLYSPKVGGDKRYRGRFYSDACGKFQYIQTFPEIYQQRDIRHVHLKFSIAQTTDEEAEEEMYSLVTQMYFRDFIPSKYNGYLQGRDSQIVDIITNTTTGEKKVFMTVVLDLDETDLPNKNTTSCTEHNKNDGSSLVSSPPTISKSPTLLPPSSPLLSTPSSPPTTSSTKNDALQPQLSISPTFTSQLPTSTSVAAINTLSKVVKTGTALAFVLFCYYTC